MAIEALFLGFFGMLLLLAFLGGIIGTALMTPAAISTRPRVLDKIFDYKGEHCACYLGLHRHTHSKGLI